MNSLIKILAKSGLVKDDLDYHLVRASMVLIFLLFGFSIDRLLARRQREPAASPS